MTNIPGNATSRITHLTISNNYAAVNIPGNVTSRITHLTISNHYTAVYLLSPWQHLFPKVNYSLLIHFVTNALLVTNTLSIQS